MSLTDNIDFTAPLPERPFIVNDDTQAVKILVQLGRGKVFDRYASVEQVIAHESITRHPTHWLLFAFCKGHSDPSENGLCFSAFPKTGMSRAQFDALTSLANPHDRN